MIQFYLPTIHESPVLPPTESGHCIRVLRMKEGDEIVCIDGRGGRYRCTILEAHPKHVSLQIESQELIERNWPCNITLAFAPTKNLDRIEWLAEKCTEMGIDTFIPVRCSRSERKELKTERIEKILISAMKQSLKTYLPALHEMTPLKDVLTAPIAGQKFICYCGAEIERRELCKEYIPGSDATVLIGPEGDFSPEEIELALAHGWLPVALGSSRLRAETAGMYAVAAIHAINQRQL